MAWIQVDEGVKEHDKIYNLADALKISNAYAVGLMVCFWTWAVTSAPDGDVTNFPPRAIAKAAGWEKKPEVFYNAILSEEIRFLEKRDNKIYIRNWEQRAELLMDAIEQQKEKTRQRVQRYRERKKKNYEPKKPSHDDENVTPCNGDCNVTVTPCNAPTKPNPTVPNPTVPNPTISKLSVNNDPLPTTVDSMTEDEARVLSTVGQLFEMNVKPMPSSADTNTLVKLIKTYGADKVLSAIDEAKKGKGHSVNYVQRILEGWERDGKNLPGTATGPDLTDPERYKNFGK